MSENPKKQFSLILIFIGAVFILLGFAWIMGSTLLATLNLKGLDGLWVGSGMLVSGAGIIYLGVKKHPSLLPLPVALLGLALLFYYLFSTEDLLIIFQIIKSAFFLVIFFIAFIVESVVKAIPGL